MVNFSALYLSTKRLSEVVAGKSTASSRLAAVIADIPAGPGGRGWVIASLEDGVVEWLNRAKLPTLGQVLIEGRATRGTFFSHLGPFYGKGVAAAKKQFDSHEPVTAQPRLRAKLDSFLPGAALDVFIHPENYTTSSSSSEMSGKHRLFMVARLTEDTPPSLHAQAYAIGHLHDDWRPTDQGVDPLAGLPNHMEVYPSQIDNFNRIDTSIMPSAAELRRLKDIPEAVIKRAFASLTGQPFVPADWGGERSDLVTSSLFISGEPMVAAFAFKGPARFRRLTVADLGKNGDQISRLFSEPADLAVLQHCHEVAGAVRDHMRAFATRVGQLRRFCIIDGADTVRILKAYRQLGFQQNAG